MMPRKLAAGESSGRSLGFAAIQVREDEDDCARVTPELKEEAERILDEIGLSSGEAIRMFYKQVILQKGLPFAACIPRCTDRKALRDAEAGWDMTDYANVDEMFEDLGI